MTAIAGGFRFLEGPVWHPRDHYLVFSDIQGNALYRWDTVDGVQLLRANSHLANGNTYDTRGRLITCEHGTSRLTRTELDGTVTVLAERYGGKALNSPNDVVVRSDGSIYFTDPTSGRTDRYGIPRPQELDFQGVYRFDPESGELTLLVEDFSKPNGLCFLDSETALLVNDTDRQHICIFPVLPEGTLGTGKLFTDLVVDSPGVADGMKIDSSGRVFCSAPGGLQIFDRSGTLICRLRTPEVAANFTWGGPDLRTLFLTASTTLYSIPTVEPGLPLFQVNVT